MKIDSTKRTNIILFVVMSAIFFSASFFWSYCISNSACVYDIIRTTLRPVYYGSLSLLVFFGFFLLLPAHYFTNWLKKIFSWAFPISVLIVMANVSGGGGPFPIFAREVIIMLSVFFGVVTLLYVLWHWHTRKN